MKINDSCDKFKIILKFGLEERNVTIVRSKFKYDNPKHAFNEDAYNMISDLYGNDLDINIMENVKYFICRQEEGKAVMKLLSSLKVLRNKNIIQVVIWSNTESLIDGIFVSGHHLINRSSRQIKICRQCKRHIWGIGSHAYCTLCGAHVHRKCAFELCIPCRTSTMHVESNPRDLEKVLFVSNSKINENDSSVIPKSGFATISYFPNTWQCARMNSIENHQNIPVDLKSESLERDISSKVIKNMIYKNGVYSGTFATVKDRENVRYKFTYEPKSHCLILRINGKDVIKICMDDFKRNGIASSLGIDAQISTYDLNKIVTTIAFGLSEMEKNQISNNSNQSPYVEDKLLDFNKLYEVRYDHVLGVGRFATVVDGICKNTNSPVAIKIIKLDSPVYANACIAEKEANILNALDYPAILKCQGLFKTHDSLILITEKLDIDMLEFILHCKDPVGCLSEDRSKFLCFQIICALNYIHSQNIAHCDLKPENVLLRIISSELQQVKLADFGYATIIRKKSVRHSLVGTPAYLPPEVFNKELRMSKGYNHSIDLWSFGVIVYVSLCGCFPYRDDRDLLEQVNQQSHIFTGGIWKTVTSVVKNLISDKLLVASSSKRLSSKEVIVDQWFTADSVLSTQITNLERIIGEKYMSAYLLNENL